MCTYIVLLRGINVGGNNLLAMSELTAMLQDEGFEDVRTYIQSGNLLLTDRHDRRNEIANLIQSKFGFKPVTVILSHADFCEAMENNPFYGHIGKNVHFFFCERQPQIDRQKLDQLAAPDEEYHLQGCVLYLHTPSGLGRSKLAAKISGILGVAATARNMNTVTKINQLQC